MTLRAEMFRAARFLTHLSGACGIRCEPSGCTAGRHPQMPQLQQDQAGVAAVVGAQLPVHLLGMVAHCVEGDNA